MTKLLSFLFALALVSPASAADNYTATQGMGTTFAAKDVAGVYYPWTALADSSGAELFVSGNAGYVRFPSAQAVTLTSTTITGTVAVTQSGTWTVNPTTAANWGVGAISSAVPANAVRMGANLGGNLTGLILGVASADAITSSTAALDGRAFNLGYNGTSWDLLRSGAVSNVAAATGYLNALGVGIYNATPPTITDTRYNAFQLDVNGNLKVVGQGVAQGSTTSGQTIAPIGCRTLTAAPTDTTAQTNMPSCTTAGALRVNLTASATPVAPATATATQGVLMGGQYNATIPTFTDGQQGSLQLNASGSLRVRQGNAYPDTAVPYTNSATGTTSGAVATLAGASSVTTYICGFSVRANATAATTVNIVVSGTISGSLNFTEWVAPLASGLGIAEMIFTPCIPASGANTSIVVTGGAPGSGGVNSTSAWGYKL